MVRRRRMDVATARCLAVRGVTKRRRLGRRERRTAYTEQVVASERRKEAGRHKKRTKSPGDVKVKSKEADRATRPPKKQRPRTVSRCTMACFGVFNRRRITFIVHPHSPWQSHSVHPPPQQEHRARTAARDLDTSGQPRTRLRRQTIQSVSGAKKDACGTKNRPAALPSTRATAVEGFRSSRADACAARSSVSACAICQALTCKREEKNHERKKAHL